jgi:energy-coupling factor transporter ATP-binding protein EcfA2
VISVRELSKRYGGTLAVDGVSFNVRPGTVTGFLGPNGSGKSTTMRMIMGLDAPSRGRALIDGMPYKALRWPLRSVGAVLEARSSHPGRSDCRGDYEELVKRGVEFSQPPAERPYGVEAVLRDDSGNWFSFTQRTW